MSTKHLAKGKHVLHAPIRVTKSHPEAEIPFKEIDTEASWDITVVSRCDSRVEDITHDVNTFSTGLVIRPPTHYHMEVYPHPTLWGAGYMLAGPIIINPDNEEELVLPLYKYKDVEDLGLPFRAGRLVLRETEYAVVATETAAAVRRQAVARAQLEEEIEFAQPVQPKKGAARKQPRTNHMF